LCVHGRSVQLARDSANERITCAFRDGLYGSPEISVTDGITCVFSGWSVWLARDSVNDGITRVFRDVLYGTQEIAINDGITCVFRDVLYELARDFSDRWDYLCFQVTVCTARQRFSER